MACNRYDDRLVVVPSQQHYSQRWLRPTWICTAALSGAWQKLTCRGKFCLRKPKLNDVMETGNLLSADPVYEPKKGSEVISVWFSLFPGSQDPNTQRYGTYGSCRPSARPPRLNVVGSHELAATSALVRDQIVGRFTHLTMREAAGKGV